MPECGEVSLACLGQLVVLSYLRFAVGAFVLAASLLIGNAAVADADSSDSAAPGPGGANASIQGSSTASRPVGDVTDTLRTKIQRVMRTLGSVRQTGQQPYRGAEMPNIGSGGTDIKDGTKPGSGLGAAVADPVAAVPNEVAPVSDAVAAVPNEVAPVSGAVAAVPNEVAPVSNAVPPVPDVVGPVSNAVDAAVCRGGAGSEWDRAISNLRASVVPLNATAFRPLFLLVGHRQG